MNLAFGQPPRDQCEYRRRRLFAYSLQPIGLAIWAALIIVIRIIYALLLGLFGFRMEITHILHPFQERTADMYRFRGKDPRKHFFGYNLRQERRAFGFAMLHPMNWVAAVGVLSLLYFLPISSYYFLGWLMLAISGLAAGLTIAIPLWEKLQRVVEKETSREERERRMEEKRAEADEAEKRLLARRRKRLANAMCGLDERPVLEALQHTSVVLRFQALKSRVCKPYRW